MRVFLSNKRGWAWPWGGVGVGGGGSGMRIRLFYEHAGALYCEGERLPADSCEGAQQGDPLGPYLEPFDFYLECLDF